MTLPTDQRDKYNIPYPKTQIAQVEGYQDWGYGAVFQDAWDPNNGVTSASFHPTKADAENNTNGTPATAIIASGLPAAGQLKSNFMYDHQLHFLSANSADNAKWVRAVGTCICTMVGGKLLKDFATAINTNESAISSIDSRVDALEASGGGTGSVEFKIKSVVPTYNGDLTQTANIIVNMTKDVDATTLNNVTLQDSVGAVACTVSLNASDAKQIIINPDANLTVANNPQKVVILPGLTSTDSEVLGYSVEWAFNAAEVAVNQPPTVTVAVTGTTTVGSTLTASTTVTDPEGDTVASTAWEWLRDDALITGATANTYVLTEADVGTTIKARATVTMSTGTNPSPATSSGTSIPVPAPPSLSVASSDGKITCTFTQNTTLSTETYNAYYTTDGNDPTTASTKLTSVTSPFDITATNGTTVKVALEMVVNEVASALSAVVSGVPSNAVFEDTFTAADGSAPDGAKWDIATKAWTSASASSVFNIVSNKLRANIIATSHNAGVWPVKTIVSKTPIPLGTGKIIEFEISGLNASTFAMMEVCVSPEKITADSEALSNFIKVSFNAALYWLKKNSGARSIVWSNTSSAYQSGSKKFRITIDATTATLTDITTTPTQLHSGAHGLNLSNGFYLSVASGCDSNSSTYYKTFDFDNLTVV